MWTFGKLAIAFLAAASLCANIWMATGGRNRVAPPLQPAAQEAAGPAPVDEARDRGFIGVIVAGDTVELEPRVEGRLREVLVHPGDQVAAGKVLARLDVASVEDELTIAGAALHEARRRLQRRVRLGRGVFTDEEMDGQRRELAQARARVAKLRRAVADGRVTAPFDATVTELYQGPGALAGPGKPIVRLVGRGEPRVRFAVPEDRSRVLSRDAAVTVVVQPAGPTLHGRVSGVSPDVDAASRMVYAAATIAPRGSLSLPTGLMVRVFVGPPALDRRRERAP
jgi:RND family efflux transporter MFP subunit